MEKHLRLASFLTRILEKEFSILGYRFGLDPLLGLIVGAGDMVTVIIGFYFIWIATKLQVPFSTIMQMVWNVLVDFAIGSIPLLGDIFDFAYHPHTKNLRILEMYDKKRRTI